MATHASAEKRYRQSLVARTRNRWWKSRVINAAKEVLAAVEKGEKDSAQTALKKAVSEIDRARLKGIVARNTASRRVARLSRLVSQL